MKFQQQPIKRTISNQIYVQSGESYNISDALFPEYSTTNYKLCMCAKRKHKQIEIFHQVDPRTFQNKAAETIFRILEPKNVSITSTGNSSFP